MPSNFAVRFQNKYPTLGEAWRQFARGEVPESLPPEWRGVNYYASVFSNETELPLRAAAQAFLSALDAAKFDGRTYIARLTLATQTFAQAVCQSAGLKWEPALSSGQGGVTTRPVGREQRRSASDQAVNLTKLPVMLTKAETPPPQPVAAPPVVATSSEAQRLAGRPASAASAPQEATTTTPAKPKKSTKSTTPAKSAKRPTASSQKPVKSKGPVPRTARKSEVAAKPKVTKPAAKRGPQPAGRKVSKLKPAPKPTSTRKPARQPVKPKPGAKPKATSKPKPASKPKAASKRKA